jgi:hypothetical protein
VLNKSVQGTVGEQGGGGALKPSPSTHVMLGNFEVQLAGKEAPNAIRLNKRITSILQRIKGKEFDDTLISRKF